MCDIAKNKNISEYNLIDFLSEPAKELLRKEIIPGAINNGSWEGEVTLVNLTNKKEIPVSMLFLSHKNEEGNAERFSTISRDISETKEREQQILNLYQELERKTAFLEASNKEIDSFTYVISHDLRAPIRAIHGFTKVLETSFANQVNEEGMKLLSSVSQAATRMGQLIDDLLHFSKIRRRDVQRAVVNMTEIVKEIVEQEIVSTSEPPRHKVTVHDLPDALCDKGLIRQVWLSLLLNAHKFSSTKPYPVIEVGSRTIRNATVYYVKDNGVGFDMKYYDKLFNVFQRLHHWDEFPGTGIGLAIAHRIIVHHGGKMWAQGIVNEGSTFYFCLPK
jgi:light-regulated signal transduction histidine kinase (bacteriophytochrome)